MNPTDDSGHVALQRQKRNCRHFKMKDCQLHFHATIENGELILRYHDRREVHSSRTDGDLKRVNPNGRLEVAHNPSDKESHCHIHFDEPGYRLHVYSIDDEGHEKEWADGRRRFDLAREGNEMENYFFLVAVGNKNTSPRTLFLDPIIVYRPKPPPDDDIVLEISDGD